MIRARVLDEAEERQGAAQGAIPLNGLGASWRTFQSARHGTFAQRSHRDDPCANCACGCTGHKCCDPACCDPGPMVRFGNTSRAMRGLGMIPSWQFSNDPAVNIKINPYVRFPDGWNQRTVQPVGPFYAPPEVQFNGLFDSAPCEGRKWLLLGGLGLVGLASLIGAGVLLR